ncbi:hypothetical protein BBJ28_00017276, partial [Nothophytophthora sp. Chile5]
AAKTEADTLQSTLVSKEQGTIARMPAANHATTPAFKRQRLREILASPVESNERNAQQLRALAERVNTSVMTSLTSEIERVRHEELQTRQQMHSMIQQERERLPLKFLFQLPGGAVYCRHRMRRAMALWVLEFEDNQRRMALMQWKAVVEHARFQERGVEYHRLATKKRLKVAIEYVLREYQQQALRKWVETTQALIWCDRDAATRLIQAQIRRHLGRNRLLTLHRRAPFANPVLRDLYLAPRRPKLPFQLPAEVREHRRSLWRAAELVQSAYRRHRFRIALARYRAAAIKIQALQRMRADRAHYHHTRRRIILFQARIRMRVCRDAYLALRDAALLVQSVFRSVRMRRLRRLVLSAQRKESERLLSGAVLLQRVARGFLGRCEARELRRVRDQEWHAALIFQRCWYSRNNEWSTFLLLGCLREKESEEREFEAHVLAYKRNHMARLISRTWLTFLAAKRDTAASLIQRNVRRHAAQQLVGWLRRRRMAHRRIKWFFRVRHAKRVLTARWLQFWWLKAVPGRLRRHLHAQRLANALEDARRRFELEEGASTRMQALVRGHNGRQLVLRQRGARSIQRAIRKHLLRKHLREQLARIRADVARHSAAFCIQTALQVVVDRKVKRLNDSAREIQRIFRGCHCRTRLMRSMVHDELQTRMAVRVQHKWRHSAHQRLARKLLQAQRRQQMNPFRSEDSMNAIIAGMLHQSAEFFDPTDELQGLAVQEWLRRLGLASKYSEVFQKSRWLASLEPLNVLKQLRELDYEACEEKLETIGVQDAEDRHVMLTNLFALQTIEDTRQQRRKLALAREKQTQLKRSCDLAQKHLQVCAAAQLQHEDALDEVLEEAKEFRHPPKAVRGRQAVCAQELEQALKASAQASAKYETATNLHAMHIRELATEQQRFVTQQEPKEVSAVHSLRSLRLIAQLNVAREMFLERFPGLSARALAFVGAFGENRVTRWQLERFFETNTTISEVKHNMKELTFFALETEVKKHDHMRFGQCAEVLQFGHERIGGLLGLSVEALVLGADRVGAGSGLLQRTLLDILATTRNARTAPEKAQLWRLGADAIAKMNSTAVKLQSLWHRRAGKKLMAGLRYSQLHERLRENYLAEFHTDRVTPLWQAERKKEQEELDAWLKEKAKAHRMQVLYGTLRYPYVEEWDDEVQAYVYAIYTYQEPAVSDLVDEELQQTQSRQYVTEKPTYTVEEEDVVIRIQVQTRRFLAQRRVKELQRLQRRQRQRNALEVEWDAARQERAQLLTLKFQLQFQDNANTNAWVSKRVKSKPKPQQIANTRRSGRQGDASASSPSNRVVRKRKDDKSGVLNFERATGERHQVQLQATLDAAVDALAPTYNVSVRAEHRRNWSFPVHSRPANAHGRAIVRLLERLQAFHRQTASIPRVVTSLRYTKMELRFGWEEVRPTLPLSKAGDAEVRPYFFNTRTQEATWERPDYSFEEQFAAIRIQAFARVILATNARGREIAAISFMATVQETIRQAARIGWVGYALEGMTSVVFLSRFGLTKQAASSLGRMPLPELLVTISSEQKAKGLGWSKEEAALVSLFPRAKTRRFPQSCKRETSVPTTNKHPFNFLPVERVLSQLVAQSFPNQQGRVVGLLRSLRASTTPISYRQLEMHLRKFAGRPDDAIAHVGEIASLAVATREPQEKEVFVLYRRCAEQCVVFAANMGLSTLQRELSIVLQMPRLLLSASQSSEESEAHSSVDDVDIIGTSTAAAVLPVVPVSPQEEKRWLEKALARYPGCAAKGLWEHEATSSFSFAQMALYLREEALERVLAWERTALLCQTIFRMLRTRRWYVATQRFRALAATTIQCAWRSLGARETHALLESQQRSMYEQRLDKRTGAFYFVYTPTDEKLLEEPRDTVTGGILPFRPMVQDRLTKCWLLAWPHYTPASRQPRPSSSRLGGHGADSRWTACSICGVERASRRCNECYSPTGDYVDCCLSCFYDLHLPAATAIQSEDISWHSYSVLHHLLAPFFRCVECSRPSTLRCLPCEEHYCDRCFTRVHARGKTRSRHAREWYAAHAPVCVECEMRVACQRCLACQDTLCETCMARTHAGGRGAEDQTHAIELLPQPLDPGSGDVYCEQCHSRRGDEQCEFCAKTLCAVCRWSSTSTAGVKSSRHALECVETALVEKRRELLGDRGLCVECGKAADRECATCGDRYCSVRWMGNPGCFERFHSKGKRGDHTFVMVDVPTEMPPELVALEEQVRAKRRRDAEAAEREAKRMAAALLEDGDDDEKKKAAIKKSKSKKRLMLEASVGPRICAVAQCQRRALALATPGALICEHHFTLQHALEVTGQDPLEAVRLLALVENGGGRRVETKRKGWRMFLPSGLFTRWHVESADVKAKPTDTSFSGERKPIET